MDTEQKAETLEFAPLKLHPNYVISTTEPFIIRRIKDGKFMKYSKNNSGYIYLSIDGKSIELHRIIAEQFILNDNPNVKTDIDHINGNKLDNRIKNIERVSHSENLKRRIKYNHQKSEYIDTLDGLTIIPFTEYNNEKLNRYFYDKTNEKLYLKTRANGNKGGTPKFHYKLVKPCFHNNLNIITLTTADGNYKSYSYNKLMKHLKTL